MRKNPFIFILFALTIAFSGCQDFNDDIESLSNRVASLEEWQKSVISSIISLQTIVSAPFSDCDLTLGASQSGNVSGKTWQGFSWKSVNILP